MRHVYHMPLEAKIMNYTANLLVLVFFVIVFSTLVLLFIRLPIFTVKEIVLQGDTVKVSTLSIRSAVANKISDGIFTVNLDELKDAIESKPWVRQALVQRSFPNKLTVKIQEHKAVALWGDEPDSRMVNNFGEIFEANRGEVENDVLVTLYGSDDRAKEVLSMYKALTNTLLPFKLSLSGLKMSHRATWIAQLDNGAILQLGSGDEASVTQRTNDFLRTLPDVNDRLAKSLTNLEFADLRHKDGYAIRLKGVTTDFAPAKASAKAE